MSVNDLIGEQDQLSAHRHTFFLWPRQWAAYNFQGFFNWQIYPFQQNQKKNIPMQPGIYSFVIKPGIISYPDCLYLMYIGKAEYGLRHRFNRYFRELDDPAGRPKIVRLLNRYQGYLHFCYSIIEEKEQIAETEKALIGALLPPCNDQFPAGINRIIGGFQ